jgi:ribosome-binding factor A
MKRIPYERAERVADQIFQVVAELFTEDAEDPRLKG